MPISNAHGWLKRVDAHAQRAERAKAQESVRNERYRMRNEAEAALDTGNKENTLIAAEQPPPLPEAAPVQADPNVMTVEELRAALADLGMKDVPKTAAKARLVEIYQRNLPPPKPKPPPKDTIPALPPQE